MSPRKINSVFLILALGFMFGSVCMAAPLMVEKNLFSPDRKPPSNEAGTSKGAAGPSTAAGDFQLDGVVIQNNLKKAVVRMKSQPAGGGAGKGKPAQGFISVQEGQVVNSYRVSKIEPKCISLEKDGQTFTISLFANNKVVTAPSPPPPPVPVSPPPQPAETAQPGSDRGPGAHPHDRSHHNRNAQDAPSAQNAQAPEQAQVSEPPPVAEQSPEPEQPAETIEMEQ